MEDETYRRILRMKALERWENEGGRITDDVTTANMDRSTDVESSTCFSAGTHESSSRDTELTNQGP